jgi:hypothetical protein
MCLVDISISTYCIPKFTPIPSPGLNSMIAVALVKKRFSGYGDLFSNPPIKAGRLPIRRPCLLPPPSLRRMELRTGTKRDQCLNNLALWGCCHICSILVPFDVTQGPEPVEGPYHNLRTYGGGLEKGSPYPVLGA